MQQIVRRLWAMLERVPRVYLTLALGAEASAAMFVSRSGRVETGLIQFRLGAEEILAVHRIHSTFLPVGYPALLGWVEVASWSHGKTAMAASIIGMQIVLLLVILLLARAVLLEYGSARFATTTALIVSLYPQVIVGANRISDTDLTLLLLLGVWFAVLRLRKRGSWPYALLAGAFVAASTVVRPNLALMALLLIWSVWKIELRAAIRLLGVSLAAMLAVYCAITSAVHGRPFFPSNGPYNLYAGYNPYSEEYLLRELNAEDSILPATAAAGIHAGLDWSRPSNLPGIDDVRDDKYAPYYTSSSKSFVRAHPAEAIGLSGIKLFTFFRQSYDNKLKQTAPSHSLTVWFKESALLVFPIWGALLLYPGWRRMHLASPLTLWMAALYVIPFVLINSDPRFRIPLESVVLIDVARMLYLLRIRSRTGAGDTVGHFNAGMQPGPWALSDVGTQGSRRGQSQRTYLTSFP